MIKFIKKVFKPFDAFDAFLVGLAIATPVLNWLFSAPSWQGILENWLFIIGVAMGRHMFPVDESDDKK